jgi:CheY-like chemotaxis protein
MDRRVVVVNLDGNASAMVAALAAQGVPATACEPGLELATELDQPAALLLASGELYAPRTLAVLQQLAALPEGDVLPIALVAENTRDAPLVRQLRSGVVELLTGPFNPRLHVQRVKQLLEEIPRRLGMMRGRGAGKELTAVLEHLVRTLRSGELTVGEGDDAARAWFIKGRTRRAPGRKTWWGACARCSSRCRFSSPKGARRPTRSSTSTPRPKISSSAALRRKSHRRHATNLRRCLRCPKAASRWAPLRPHPRPCPR